MTQLFITLLHIFIPRGDFTDALLALCEGNLWVTSAICHHIPWPLLVGVMAWCLMAPSHYLNLDSLLMILWEIHSIHYSDIIMSEMASQITSLTHLCITDPRYIVYGTLHWRHNDHGDISNHQPHGCLLNHLFSRRSKKTSKLCVTGLCVGNSLATGEFPAQRASNTENISIWWHHVKIVIGFQAFSFKKHI